MASGYHVGQHSHVGLYNIPLDVSPNIWCGEGVPQSNELTELSLLLLISGVGCLPAQQDLIW